jgi:flagellar biosynthesis/type III secretory pathway M-ring protein FliF/YscJ
VKLVVVKTRIPEEEQERLEQMAREQDRSVAQLLRLWIREKLNGHEKETRP